MREFSATHLDELENLNSMYQFVYYMCEHCNRNGRVQLEKHGATVNEIKNSEKLYDSVRKEANQLLDTAKLPSGMEYQMIIPFDGNDNSLKGNVI